MSNFYTRGAARALALAAAVSLSACDSADIDAPATASVGLLIEPVVGTDAFDAARTYTVGGRATSFAVSRLFVSDVALLRADGTAVRVLSDAPLVLPARDDAGATVQHTVDGTVHYAPLDLGAFRGTLGTVPAGDYAGVRFTVGLSAATNRVDATQAPAASALEIRTDVGNWWSWNSGYILAANEGRVDLDGDGHTDGAADAGWRVHLGTAPYAVTVDQARAFTVEGGTTPEIHLEVDLARLLQGIDLADPAQRDCMTFGCAGVAATMQANLAAGVTLHGLHAD